MNIEELTSGAVDEFQRPMIVVTRDVIDFTAVIARDHDLVAMTTNPRVAQPRHVRTTVHCAQ